MTAARTQRRTITITPALVATDLVALVLAVLVGGHLAPLAAAGAVLGALVVAGALHLNRSRLVLSVLEDLPALAFVALTGGVLLMAFDVSGARTVGESIIGAAVTALAMLGALIVSRSLAYAMVRHLRRTGVLAHRVVVVGTDKIGRELVSALRADPTLGLRPLGFVDDDVDPRTLSAPLLGPTHRLPAVLRGIEAARRAGVTPLKINAVLMRDTLDGAGDLVAWALDHGVELRFIEQMPLDADEAWVRENMVDAAELIDSLAPRFVLSHPHRDDPHAPAETWLVNGGPASIGIIASVTRSFCEACDRTRLTAEGTVRSCLFGDDETDLRGLLRGGATDDELAERWRAAMWGKQAGHGMSLAGFRRPERTMGAIGG